MRFQAFIDSVVRAARKRGDDAATTFVIIAAARAAADISARRADGSIDEVAARHILSKAVSRLARAS